MSLDLPPPKLSRFISLLFVSWEAVNNFSASQDVALAATQQMWGWMCDARAVSNSLEVVGLFFVFFNEN